MAMDLSDLRAEEDLFSDGDSNGSNGDGGGGSGAEELTAPFSAPDGPATPEESHRFCARFFSRLAAVEIGGGTLACSSASWNRCSMA